MRRRSPTVTRAERAFSSGVSRDDLLCLNGSILCLKTCMYRSASMMSSQTHEFGSPWARNPIPSQMLAFVFYAGDNLDRWPSQFKKIVWDVDSSDRRTFFLLCVPWDMLMWFSEPIVSCQFLKQRCLRGQRSHTLTLQQSGISPRFSGFFDDIIIPRNVLSVCPTLLSLSYSVSVRLSKQAFLEHAMTFFFSALVPYTSVYLQSCKMMRWVIRYFDFVWFLI